MSVESHNKGIVYYPNKAVNVSPAHDSIVHACNHVALNENGDTGQSVELQTDNELGNMFMIQYDPALKGHKKITPSIATTHTQTTSFSNTAMLDVEPSENDVDLLNSDPTLVQQLIDGNTTGLSFLAENVKHYYPCNDILNATDFVPFIQDVVLPLSSEMVTNGYMDGDTGWGYNGSYWSFENGLAVCLGSGRSQTYQGVGSEGGKVYRVSYEIKRISQGEFRSYLGGMYGELYTEIGVHTELIAPTSTTDFRLYPETSAEGDIDNISIREVYGATIVGYTDNCRDYFKNVNYGLPTTRINQDDTGRLLSMAEPFVANYTTDGRVVKPNVKPNLDVMSIREVVGGELQEFGENLQDEPRTSAMYAASGENIQSDEGDFAVCEIVDSTTIGASRFTAANGLSQDAEVGKTYKITFKGYCDGSASGKFRWDGFDGTVTEFAMTNELKTYTVSGVCDSAWSISLSSYENTIGDKVYIHHDVLVEEITGTSQRVEDRVHVWDDVLLEEAYYINGILQGTLPARPDKDTVIVLGNTAVLGNPDVITERRGNFQLSSVMWTAQEISDKFDAMRVQQFAVTHNGDEVQHNGDTVVNFK